jgi:hypothetical protein
MRDTMMEMRDLRVFVLHAATSRLCLSHIVANDVLVHIHFLGGSSVCGKMHIAHKNKFMLKFCDGLYVRV